MHPVIDQKVCIHCGTPFRPAQHRPDFCCAGCQFVHDLITKNNLGQFYDLQEGLTPVKSLVFQKRDYTWMEEPVRLAEQQSTPTLLFDVQGLSCIGCVWLIEKLFNRKPGALAIRVDPTLGQLELRWQAGMLDVVSFVRELQSFGYLVGPPGKSDPHTDRSLTVRIGLCAALAMNAMLFTLPGYLGMRADFQFAGLFERLQLILGTLSFLIGGSYFLVRTWRSVRQGILPMDLPISIGLIAAYLGSTMAWTRGAQGFVYFDFVAMFTFLMLVGRWLQQKTVERNRRQLLAAQADPSPVINAETGDKLPVSEVQAGVAFIVAPGQTVPVRALLCSKAATLGLEWINGESEPVVANRGRLVTAGAVNCSQEAITLEALESWRDSLLARLLHIPPTAIPRDLVLERFIRGYILAVSALALVGFCGWWVTNGQLLPALQVFISILVVSCPCASGVALPLTRDLAAARLRRAGVFIRESEIWAKLAWVRHIVFDKTGTLTLETISLRNPEALQALTEDERSILLAMVRENRHPVSGCLREQLLADGVAPAQVGEVVEHVGFGLKLKHEGSLWWLGRASSSSRLGCVFIRDDSVLGSFDFGEEARADAVEEIAALKARGCHIFILSGDRRDRVATMARKLGLSESDCHGELSPEEKAAWLENYDVQDTLFLGDGANDSLAFDAAWCAGTPAIDGGLLEQKADFYFLGRGLNGVRLLLDTAARRRRVARAVVAFALAYNTVAIALCLMGRMNPLLAAILMPASSLVSLAIVIGGLRSQKTG